MPTISGIDVSYWQTTIDWSQVAAAGYKFAAIRATVGSDYVDPRFVQNFDGAKKAGLFVSIYHVVRPKHTAAAQMDTFFNAIGTRKSDLPISLDVEMPDGATPDVITNVTRQCIQIATQRSGGRKPIIYTARWFWNNNIQASAEWAQYDLWVASYGTASPIMPRDWTKWKIWQYSDKGSVPGVGSRNTDLDWFNGTLEELRVYAGVVPQPPPPNGGSTSRKLRARVTDGPVNIRTGPAIAYEDVGDLAQGAEVTILEFTGKQVWVKISATQERWCAFALDGEPFMRLTTDNPTKATTLVTLNVRSAPNTSATILEQIPKDRAIEIYSLRGSDVWLEIQAGKWAAMTYHDTSYMTLI